MEWGLNFLVKILGAFLTSIGFSMAVRYIVRPESLTSIGLLIGFLTIGLALLFAPEIKAK